MASKSERERAIKKRWAQEYLRCREDREYFMRQYCYIQDQRDGGKTKFDLYPFQERALSEIEEHRFSVILKSRQMGISTLTAGYALHSALFTNDCNITIVALKQDVAKGLLKKVKIMHDNLPAFLRERTPIDNQFSVEFSNGSFIQAASSSSSTAGRSESLSLLIIDEAAFIKNAGELWSSVKPTLSTGGKAIVLSTPYGVGSWYHRTWTQAVEGAEVVDDTENREVWADTGVNNFHPIKLHWSLHPRRDEEWREEMGRDLAPREAAREFDCSFESSGNTVIDPDLLKDELPLYTDTPGYKVRVRGQNALWVWDEPEPNTRYVIGADVARGDSDDFSACSVFDVETMKQACEYKGHIRPGDYGELLVRLGAKYNVAVVVVERNSLGWETLGAVQRAEYPRMLWTSNNLQHVHIGADEPDRVSIKPGINTSSKTKNQMVIKFEEWVRKHHVTLRSTRLVEELRTFVWHKPDKAGHLEGYNDDTIIAAMLAVWARDSALRVDEHDREMSERSVSGIKTRSHSGVYGGAGGRGGDPYNDPITEEDMRWLID